MTGQDVPGPGQNAAAIIDAYRRMLALTVAPGTAPALAPVLDIASDDRPCVLILSPHPDDECLTGGMAMRLQAQSWRVVNLAVTLGSDKARRPVRLDELGRACGTLGIEIVLPRDGGLDAVTLDTSANEPELWRGMVRRIGAVLATLRPALVVMPHGGDGHRAHVGTHALGLDALAAMDGSFTCHVALSEYWQAMDEPNLMLGLDGTVAARLLEALACHAGEVARNPYDVRFPAWLIDNVRRGSERVGGAGGKAAALDFAMLYQVGRWRGGRYMPSALKRTVRPDEDLAAIFEN